MLTGITLQNWTTHRHLTVGFSPLTIVAGPNGSGKSSIRDAIAFCVLAELTRVESKGERAKLLTEGTQAGSVQVHMGNATATRDIASGKMETTGPLPIPPDAVTAASPYLIAADRFASTDADTRRTLLLQVARVDMSPAGLLAVLAERSHPVTVLEALRGAKDQTLDGWRKLAERGAAENRGAWKAITGETYGSSKAEAWKAAAPTTTPSAADLDRLRRDVTLFEGQVAAAHKAAGASEQMRQEIARVRSRNAVAKQAIDIAATAAERLAALDIAGLEQQYQAAETAAREANARREAITMTCPTCRECLVIADGELVAYEVPEQPVAEAEFQAAHTRAATMKRQLDDAKQKARELQTRLDAGKVAHGQIAEEPAEPDDAGIASQLRQAQEELTEGRRLLAEAEATARRAAEAEGKTAKAREAHDLVKAWVKAGEALAPSGIPAEMLDKSLGTINRTLAELSAGAGWGAVAIGSDMQITVAGRLYGLLSESEQWRADAVIAVALAMHSKMGFVVLDRFDVLQVDSRKPTLGWLYGLTKKGALTTALVLGTLRTPPVVPADVTVHWLGEPINATQEAA